MIVKVVDPQDVVIPSVEKGPAELLPGGAAPPRGAHGTRLVSTKGVASDQHQLVGGRLGPDKPDRT